MDVAVYPDVHIAQQQCLHISDCNSSGEYHGDALTQYIKPADFVLLLGRDVTGLEKKLRNIGVASVAVVNNLESQDSESASAIVTRCAKCEEGGAMTQDHLQQMYDKLRFMGRLVLLNVRSRLDVLTLANFCAHNCMALRGAITRSKESDCRILFVATKFKPVVASFKPPLDVVSPGEKAKRCEDPETLWRQLQNQLAFAKLLSDLAHNRVGAEDERQVVLSQEGSPRYTISLVHLPQAATRDKAYAAFIVPQGRETEWVFGEGEGRRQLADSAGFTRLAVASLHRGHHYTGLAQIETQLNPWILKLAPSDLRAGYKIPYLSVGGEVGQRETREEGDSGMSGHFVVEDVRLEGGSHCVRRLVFTSTPHLVQSEARLVPTSAAGGREGKSKKKGKRAKPPAQLEPDVTYLTCDHHLCFAAALAFHSKLRHGSPEVMSGLLVGLGGGLLASFLSACLPMLDLTTMELDPAVLGVAEKWFGFRQTDRLRAVVADGLQYMDQLKQTAPKSLDLLLLDVDSKDSSLGVSAPPPTFVTPDMLHTTAALLREDGLLVLNIAARNSAKKAEMLQNIHIQFPCCHMVKLPEDVNSILVASANPVEVCPGVILTLFKGICQLEDLQTFVSDFESIGAECH